MKIAILGGGVTGLTAAFYLSTKGHEIVVIEKGERLGGLAGGFKKSNWTWSLERTYHHIFSNDHAILNLARDIHFDTFEFFKPSTASLFGQINNYRIFPVDSPKDFLLLPELSLLSRVRSAFVLAFLKLSPFLKIYERTTAAAFLKKYMGEEVWKVLWEQLFLKKYGKYAEYILASFIWARINKRTQNLGYPIGGFQRFVDKLGEKNRDKGVVILTSTTINTVVKAGESYEIGTTDANKMEKKLIADIVISTLPYPITCKVLKEVVGQPYIDIQNKRKYLFAINLIIKTNESLLENAYWLNVGAADIPIMCIVQHTNFIDAKNYGGDKISYIAWYVDKSSPLLTMNEEATLAFVLPYLQLIAPHLKEKPEVVGLFKAPFAQPIFDKEFASIPREFTTPAKNVFVANMDMTYPYDRGTNYAVQLGKDINNFVLNSL